MSCLVRVSYAKSQKNIIIESTSSGNGSWWILLCRWREKSLPDCLGQVRALRDLPDNIRFSALRYPSQIARSPQTEIFLRNCESVCCLTKNVQPLRSFGRTQQAVALSDSASYTPAKLVQPGESKSFSRHDGNNGRVGDIDANFYNGCGEKNVKPPLFKLSSRMVCCFMFPEIVPILTIWGFLE